MACDHMNLKQLKGAHFMKQFKGMWDFSEGLAAVAYDKYNYGYINKEGKVIVPFEYVIVKKIQIIKKRCTCT